MNQRPIAEWLDLIQTEYRELPGLVLTKPQAQRRWGLDAVVCDALLDTLEMVRVLRRTPANGYARADL